MGYYKLAQQLNGPELDTELYTDTFNVWGQDGWMKPKDFEKKAMFARDTVTFLFQLEPASYFYYLPYTSWTAFLINENLGITGVMEVQII